MKEIKKRLKQKKESDPPTHLSEVSLFLPLIKFVFHHSLFFFPKLVNEIYHGFIEKDGDKSGFQRKIIMITPSDNKYDVPRHPCLKRKCGGGGGR